MAYSRIVTLVGLIFVVGCCKCENATTVTGDTTSVPQTNETIITTTASTTTTPPSIASQSTTKTTTQPPSTAPTTTNTATQPPSTAPTTTNTTTQPPSTAPTTTNTTTQPPSTAPTTTNTTTQPPSTAPTTTNTATQPPSTAPTTTNTTTQPPSTAPTTTNTTTQPPSTAPTTTNTTTQPPSTAPTTTNTTTQPPSTAPTTTNTTTQPPSTAPTTTNTTTQPPSTAPTTTNTTTQPPSTAPTTTNTTTQSSSTAQTTTNTTTKPTSTTAALTDSANQSTTAKPNVTDAQTTKQTPVQGETSTSNATSTATSTGLPTTTENIDDCVNVTCFHGGTCVDLMNGFNCTCLSGWNGTYCETDIDECSDHTHDCHVRADCNNTEGSYDCKCKEGFEGNGKQCNDIDECTNNNGNCSEHANCTNTEGSYNCSCNTGWMGNGTTCKDIDECTNNNGNCSEHANCTNTEGSYNCSCSTGWMGNGTTCTDIDECTNNNGNCSEHANCTNTEGSYNCSCSTGWMGNGTTCKDIDECTNNNGNCSEHANCTNTEGSYNCSCHTGWMGNGTTCTDIDECTNNNGNCSEHANCTNTEGSYNCSCHTGWMGNGTTCTDIDECTTSKDNCSEHANCTNTNGSFNCSCYRGWTGNGTTCTDIDECVNVTCLNGGTCNDLIADFNCTCLSGWNGTYCETDIDECLDDHTHDCHVRAACNNTEGSYDCKCKEGFEGSGKQCNDINECIKSSPCNSTGSKYCWNTVGSYMCICATGWNGTMCTEDIDECSSTNLSNCDQNATCNNTEGSYNCTCNDGFRGNGSNCIEKVLLEFTGGVHHTGNDEVFGPFQVPSGIPYEGKLYYQIYVSMNGYLTLGSRLDRSYPPSNSEVWDYLQFPVIYPLWADIETGTGDSGLNIQNIPADKTDDLDAIKTAFNISSFMPSYSFVVTWKDAAPYPYSVNHPYESGDFQVILATNGSDTHVMFNYDQERFTWLSKAGRYVSVGLNKNEEFNSNTFTSVHTSTNIGKTGRWVFDVTTQNAELIKQAECKRWTMDSSYKQHIKEAIDQALPCPCTGSQASLDGQFKNESTDGVVHKFEARFTRSGNKQRCHYDANGGLLLGAPNGGYLDILHADMRSDKLFKTCCETSLCSEFYSIVKSDNCKRYAPPSWSPSWGDPHFTTFDGADFTFNGLGEYTLFNIQHDESDVKVQVRTERFDDKTNATVFVGLALQENNATTIEIYLNRTTNDTEVYINGALSTNKTLVTNRVELDFIDGNFNIFLPVGMFIEVSTGDILDITSTLVQNVTNVEGLLGNNNQTKNDDFRLKNGTSLKLNSTEEDLYVFGSSWSVENDTLFKSKPAIYASDFIPDFISDQIDNIKEYFMENCNTNDTSLFDDCGNNTACKVDTAATCSKEIGTRSKKTQDSTSQIRTEANHFPPNITGPNTVYIGHSLNTTVTIEIDVSVNANVTVDTNSTAHNYSLQCTDELCLFKWNTTNSLREHGTLSLEFTARDSSNASANYHPQIIYCGCENHTECNYDGVLKEQGRYKSVPCNCIENTNGEFCNNTLDPCNLDVCFPNVTCNSSNTNQCGSCPAGMQGDGIKCEDTNECYTNTSGCEQICEDTIGSYECKCRNGFTLHADKHHCEDVNECTSALSNCYGDEYCENTIGSFDCPCRPGYVRSDGKCQKVTASFVGKLVFNTIESDKEKLRKGLRALIEYIFTNGSDFKLVVNYVEVTTIEEETNSRKRRSTVSDKLHYCEFVIHGNGSNPTSDFVNAFDEYVEDKSVNGVLTPLDIPGVSARLALTINTNKSRMYTDADAALCKIDNKVNCDLDSTDCVVSNGTYTCVCKSGFKYDAIDDSRCQDINECLLPEGDKCRSSGGNCSNTVGSYDCVCQNGFEFDVTGQQCKDMCLSGPCQNDGICMPGVEAGQIICKCEDKWTGAFCETENSELSRMTTIAIAVGASAGCVCLILVFVMLGMYRRNKNRRLGYSRRPLSTMDDFTSIPSSDMRIHKDLPLDDNIDTDTTFSIPRAKLRASEYNTIDGASNYDGLEAGKNEEEVDHPLTSHPRRIKESEKFGQSNPSFLHSEDTDRRASTKGRGNHYEYF